jgi:hypothetical protein
MHFGGQGVQPGVQAHGQSGHLQSVASTGAIPKAQQVRQQVHHQQQPHLPLAGQDLGGLLNPGAAFVGAPDGISAPPAYFAAFNQL